MGKISKQMLQQRICIANKHMESYSISYIIWKMQVESMRYYYAPITIIVTQNTKYQMLMRMWNWRNPHELLVVMQNGTANLEDSSLFS